MRMDATRRLLGASWRYGVTATYRLESLFFNGSLQSVRQQYGFSLPADFQHCHGHVEDSRCEDGDSGCGSVSYFTSVDTLPDVSCVHLGDRLVGSRRSGKAGICFDKLNDEARLPGIVFQIRGLAAKAKKAKSSSSFVEDRHLILDALEHFPQLIGMLQVTLPEVEHSETTEDVAETAKGNAVKMMETALDVLSREHSKFRTGRASAGMLDHITVEAHGVRTPLSHIAAVTVSGLQTLNVLPHDASMVKEVEKAILNSPMGLNPQVDGAMMTVPLPRLTKEHCETMCKLVVKSGESAKLAIRRARKEALDSVKSSGDLSKDQMKRFEKEIEDFTKKYTRTIDEMCKSKEKEIMS